MSGIAGWVDDQRDLSREGNTLRAMVGTMACRGPDGEAVWTSPRAAFGHRRRTLGEGDGAQPYVLDVDGRVRAVVAYSGDLYNAGELRAELAARGHRFTSGSDAEVIARGHLEWGEGLASRLTGIYGIAVWDPAAGELTLIRDRLGAKPLFYASVGAGLVFASERKALLAHPQVQPRVTADGLREVLSYAGSPGHAVFHGMSEVRPGHRVRVRHGGVKEERYWRLEAGEHEDDLDTTARTIRELLENAVREQMRADVPLCVMLSGGLDSSGVTALAAQVLRERGDEPLRTFTVTFGPEEDFKADEVWGTPDAPFVRTMVESAGASHTDIVLSAGDLLDPVVKVNSLRAKDVPSPLGNMNTSLYALCRAIAEHVPLALLGDAADGVFGGNMWMSIPQLIKAPTFPWVAMAQWGGGKHGMGTDLLDPGLLGTLDVPGYAAARYREAIAEVPALPDDTPEEKRMREVWHLGVTNWLHTLLPHGESISQAAGLAFRLPYCDHRLVSYVYGAPWAMKSFDGREKSLLRAALRGLLPESILERRKTPYPTPQDDVYARALCAELMDIVNDTSAPVAPLIDADAVKRFADEPGELVAGPRAWVSRTHAEMVLQLNAWLDLYRVQVDL
ncbi:asparagine synthase (glutamine-hydrolyzing) [Nonomuraea antimicrobica]